VEGCKPVERTIPPSVTLNRFNVRSWGHPPSFGQGHKRHHDPSGTTQAVMMAESLLSLLLMCCLLDDRILKSPLLQCRLARDQSFFFIGKPSNKH
jgi:hypothetical protein